MKELEVWWSPMAYCWRVEDGELFTYSSIDQVVGHFRDRQHPASALLVAPPHDFHTDLLVAALRRANISIVYAPA
jgi:hypothetical protein